MKTAIELRRAARRQLIPIALSVVALALCLVLATFVRSDVVRWIFNGAAVLALIAFVQSARVGVDLLEELDRAEKREEWGATKARLAELQRRNGRP